ncbi:ECF transporter S component [Caloranaerobacter azorensis]|uniref:ECF transporter S component n=1 Tax=Caloranaerobacter azorensis TaxID=116090 RepID=UPI002022EC02|nr:ECF transporter S component [Caloranaerobacter azorensis]
MQDNSVKKLTYGGLMIALVFVATAIIPQIPIPFTEGYIHAGDSMIFVAAILLGWKYGAIAGGLGSSLADLYLGYTHWVVPTLIIKGIMGL